MADVLGTGKSVPDMIEPLVGWRSWMVYKDPKEGWSLRSPQQGTLWPAGKLEAVYCAMCSVLRHFDEIYPEYKPTRPEYCQCGINAFASKELLAKDRQYSTAHIIGEVDLWGRVSVFEKGYRAQYAKPKSLQVQLDFLLGFEDPALFHEMMASLKEKYGVELELVSEAFLQIGKHSFTTRQTLAGVFVISSAAGLLSFIWPYIF